jgi:AcrR family transcriptional regulator
MARVRLDPEARRAQLVAIAYRLLEERGLDSVSVEDVADAAGVSRSLVYAYFGDRDGLVAEVYLRVLDRLGDQLTPQLPDDRAGLADVIVACLRFARDRPMSWQLLATDSVRRHPSVVQARGDRVHGLAARASGDGPAGRLIGDAILGLLEAGVWHWVDQSDLPEEEAAGLLADILWSGLRGLRRGGPASDASSEGAA